MAEYYVVHNGPQGSGNGSSVANGKELQAAIDGATAGDRILVCATGTYSPAATIDIDTVTGTYSNPIQIIGANSSGTVDGTRAEFDRSGTLFSMAVGFTHYVFRYLTHNSNLGTTNHTFYDIRDSVVADVDSTFAGTSGAFCYGGSYVTLLRCSTTGGTTGFSIPEGVVHDCVANGVNGTGFVMHTGSVQSRRGAVYNRCVAYDCTDGFRAIVSDQGGEAFVDCVAYECTNGLYVISTTTVPALLIKNCTFVDNTDGIKITTTSNTAALIENCVISHNSGYGINNASTFGSWRPTVLNSAFYSNTSGNLASGTLDSSCSTSVDPSFVDRTHATLTSRDYTLSSDSALHQLSYTDVFGTAIRQTRGAYQNGPTPAQIAAAVWTRTGRTLT